MIGRKYKVYKGEANVTLPLIFHFSRITMSFYYRFFVIIPVTNISTIVKVDGNGNKRTLQM